MSTYFEKFFQLTRFVTYCNWYNCRIWTEKSLRVKSSANYCFLHNLSPHYPFFFGDRRINFKKTLHGGNADVSRGVFLPVNQYGIPNSYPQSMKNYKSNFKKKDNVYSVSKQPLPKPSIHVYNWKFFFKVHNYFLLGSCPEIPCLNRPCIKFDWQMHFPVISTP